MRKRQEESGYTRRFKLDLFYVIRQNGRAILVEYSNLVNTEDSSMYFDCVDTCM